ncbi:MAG: hypothetical protein II773_10740 [Oscillospiraceae bacterium]|nr:hypothetical protein [Oscillospiraceae bacterium]
MDKDTAAADIVFTDENERITEHFRSAPDENARRESFCRLFGEYIGLMQQKDAACDYER